MCVHLPDMSITFYNDLQLLHGRIRLRDKHPIEFSNCDYYCLQYNHAGTIDIKIDDAMPQSVVGPSVLITSPGHTFVFGNHEGWHHNYIAFKGKRVERYIATGLLPIQQPLRHVSDSKGFFTTFENCVHTLRAGQYIEAAHHLEGLLIRLQSTSDDPERPPHYDGILDLAASMREEPAEDYDLMRKAARLNISEAHLRRLFRKITSMSPGRFLLQCRLTASADRLATTRAPIKLIAADYHFASVHHFTRVFRKQYGLPPGRFRCDFRGD